MTIELSKSDVEAVIDYIYQHVRTSPNGRGYKVWKKMFDSLNEQEPPLIVFARQLTENQVEDDPEIARITNEGFWDMYENI